MPPELKLNRAGGRIRTILTPGWARRELLAATAAARGLFPHAVASAMARGRGCHRTHIRVHITGVQGRLQSVNLLGIAKACPKGQSANADAAKARVARRV